VKKSAIVGLKMQTVMLFGGSQIPLRKWFLRLIMDSVRSNFTNPTQYLRRIKSLKSESSDEERYYVCGIRVDLTGTEYSTRNSMIKACIIIYCQISFRSLQPTKIDFIMSSPKAVMSLAPLDPQRSTSRCPKTVNADEDAAIHVGELDFSVPGSPVSSGMSSESSMSSNENKDGKRRGLLQRSQLSLRNLLGKPSYKEMTDSDPVPSEEESSPKEDMNDSYPVSLKKLLLKSSPSKESQDDEDDGRNETKDRRSKSETVTTDTQDRTKHHKC
jgi:hypothetical protein